MSDATLIPYKLLLRAAELFAGPTGFSHAQMENFFCYELNQPMEMLDLPPARNKRERFQQFLQLFPPDRQRALILRLCREEYPMWFEQPSEEDRRQLADELSGVPSIPSQTAALAAFGIDEIRDTWTKTIDRLSSDTDGAITSARTLIESVCKHILDEAGETYEPDDPLPKLYNRVAIRLNLSPSQHSEKLFRQVLGACGQVVEGIGAIRNQYGDAHGRGRTSFRAQRRHAELVVNLAGTMALFLMSTWQTRQTYPGQSGNPDWRTQ